MDNNWWITVRKKRRSKVRTLKPGLAFSETNFSSPQKLNSPKSPFTSSLHIPQYSCLTMEALANWAKNQTKHILAGPNDLQVKPKYLKKEEAWVSKAVSWPPQKVQPARTLLLLRIEFEKAPSSIIAQKQPLFESKGTSLCRKRSQINCKLSKFKVNSLRKEKQLLSILKCRNMQDQLSFSRSFTLLKSSEGWMTNPKGSKKPVTSPSSHANSLI